MLNCFFSAETRGQLRYTFQATTGTYTSVSGGSDLITGWFIDNSISDVTNIGFSFTYGCNTYTQFRASSNGWIGLGNNTTRNLSSNILSIVGDGPIIAPLWDDLATSSNIVYRTTGTAPNRMLTVEWSNMRWNSGTWNSVVNFQVRLHETSNVIEFMYTSAGNNPSNPSASIGLTGGYSNTDFYSVSGINGTTVATYGTETNNISTRPNNNTLYKWIPADMGYVSSTATQALTTSFSQCNSLQQVILGVQVNMQGCRNPMSATEFKINLAGTTNTADISTIHIYYTGNASAYATTTEFGAGFAPAAGTFSAFGSQQLVHGTNYFWIAYDVKPTATIGNLFDALCTQVTVGGFPQTLSTTNPTGSRSIVGCTASPGGVTNHSFWVKANIGPSSLTDNTRISSWNDQSGNSRHAANNDSDNQPRYYDNATRNLNFNPVVDFDEADQDDDDADFLNISSSGVLSSGNNPYAVYAVIVPGVKNLTTPGKFLFSGDAGSNNFNAFDVRNNYSINDSWNINDLIIPNSWAVDTMLMLSFDYNTTQRTMYKSGNLLGSLLTGTARTSSNNNNALGYQRTGNNEYYDGSIAEIITYANTSHSTLSRHKVESYLAIKYGITLPHDYYASNGTKVWDRSLNPAYNNNIIGVARDSISQLTQRQSKSTSTLGDLLTVYIGPSKQVNQKNNTGGFLAGNNSFLMVGTNRGHPLDSWPSTTEKPSGICCRIMREWMIQKTNFTNTDLKLEFDFNGITTGYLPLNVGDLRLLVDNDGDFSNATILNTPTIQIAANAGVATITVPASAIGNVAYFTLASVSSNTSLPLQLTAFSGSCKDQAIQLKWGTASPAEQDFVVERSVDKTSFTAVGTVKGNGARNHSWTDPSPAPGNVYYRLKRVQDNGLALYSTLVSISNCNKTSILLTTNPVTQESTLMLQLPQNDVTDIRLYDLVGRRYDVPGLTGQRSRERGVYYLPVTIPGSSPGMYLLHVTIHDERHVFRVIKP